MRTSRSTAVRRAGAICALVAAAALSLTACSDESDEPSDAAAAAESGESTDSAETDAPQEEQEQGQAAGQATAGEAVATWLTAIIEDRPVDACLAMGTPGPDGTPTANTAEMCEGDAPEAEQARQSVSALGESFTPENVGQPPVVEVAEGTESAGTTSFDGAQITVDGQTLTDVVVANSTGVEPGQIGIGVDTTDIDGRWYVTDMNLSLG